MHTKLFKPTFSENDDPLAFLDGYSLGLKLEESRRLMLVAVAEMDSRGKELAEAEAAYQEAKFERTCELADEGVSATMINLLIRGDKKVSPFRMARDAAKTHHQAAVKAANIYETDTKNIYGLLVRAMDREEGGE